MVKDREAWCAAAPQVAELGMTELLSNSPLYLVSLCLRPGECLCLFMELPI